MKYTIKIRKFGRTDFEFVDHSDSKLIAMAIAADAMNDKMVSNCQIIVDIGQEDKAVIDLTPMQY